MPIELAENGGVPVITWSDGENRFNPDSVAALHAALDAVERDSAAAALVITGAGKFFSNGLDLDRFATAPDELVPTVAALQGLLGRLLVFPSYVIMAINGHAFAGGAMFSCLGDWRIMRSDRGFWCLNEVDIGMTLTPEMTAAVTARVPRPAITEAMLTARRFSASEAVQGGIVDAMAEGDEVLTSAIAKAAGMVSKDRRLIATHKRQLNGPAAAAAGWTR